MLSTCLVLSCLVFFVLSCLVVAFSCGLFCLTLWLSCGFLLLMLFSFVLSCRVLPYLVLSYLALSCLVWCCLALACVVLSCLAEKPLSQPLSLSISSLTHTPLPSVLRMIPRLQRVRDLSPLSHKTCPSLSSPSVGLACCRCRWC